MKKSLWRAHFSLEFFPKLPCPKCADGVLVLREGKLHQERPAYVTIADFEKDPHLVPERFIMLLNCQEKLCGEVVAVAGEVMTVHEESLNGNAEWLEYLVPFTMTPAPPIIDIPERVPTSVLKELNLAFAVYWTDYRLCASRLRTSLERLMDHFGVAKYSLQVDYKKPSSQKKRRILDLSARIDKLPKKIGTTDFSETLHALRIIGNLGTHGDRVLQSAMLDAFQLYEMALGKLFEDKSQNAKAIIKRLKAHKA